MRLVTPYGGSLVDLVVDEQRGRELRKLSRDWPSVTLTARSACDLELLANGAFSPLTGFLNRVDYDAVLGTMRLADGTLWPLPVTLAVPPSTAAELAWPATLALRDSEGAMLAALHVEEIWPVDPLAEARAVLGTADVAHPEVRRLQGLDGWSYASGLLEVVRPPEHHDFPALRFTPKALRAELHARGQSRVVAFQTRNPMHRAHVELTVRAARDADAHLLVHPVVGATKPGDVDHYTRVRCYREVMREYPRGLATLSLLPLAMRMAGPRECVLHAIVRRNHGASHFIVGRDHAGPGNDSTGQPFYDPYASQDLLREHQREVGVTMVPFRQVVYLSDEDRYVPEDEVPSGAPVLAISGTEQRAMLAAGQDLPTWFTPPRVATELRRTYRSRDQQGVAVLLTGLSGAGKSTIANVLVVKLLERGGRAVTMLDGDLVRELLSSELGFSPEHRDLNVRRIGYVAAEIVRHGGIAICAPIAPYAASRASVREMVEGVGSFVLVHVATPLDVCEERDRKGLYAKARAGIVERFTGIRDPYETPSDADVVIDTTATTPGAAAATILDHLVTAGYVAPA